MEEQGTTKDFEKDIKKAIDDVKETKKDEFAKIQSENLYRKTYDCKTKKLLLQTKKIIKLKSKVLIL